MDKNFLETIHITRKIDFALLSSILTFLILYLLHTPGYETNDDLGIIRTLHETTEPFFISPILSIFFHELYNQIFWFPFFSLFLYICQLCGLYLLYRSVLINIKSQKLRVFVVLAITSIYPFFFWQLNFMSTSLFLSCAILFSVFSSNYVNNVSHINVKINCLFGFLLAVSYLIRPASVFIIMILSFPVVLQFITQKRWKQFIIIFSIVFFFIILSLLISIPFQNDDWNQYQKIRSQIVDYNYVKTENYNAIINSLNLDENDIFIYRLWWGFDSELYDLDVLKEISEKAIISRSYTFSLDTMIFNIRSIYFYFILILFFCIIGQYREIFTNNQKKSYEFRSHIPQPILINLKSFSRTCKAPLTISIISIIPLFFLLLLILGTRPVSRAVLPILLYIGILILFIMTKEKHTCKNDLNYEN